MGSEDHRTGPIACLRKYLRFAAGSPLILALLGLWTLLLVIERASPCFFLHDDNASLMMGFFTHDFRTLMETGRLAEINYYQYGGEPFLEQGETAVLYPPVYLGVALAKGVSGDVRWTIEWIVAIHLTLGFLGFYCWLREGGVESKLAALGGLVWALSPYLFMLSCSWTLISLVAGALPWVFWSFDRLENRPSYVSAIYLGLSLGLFFLQGTAQWVFYAIFFLGLYALFRLFVVKGIRRRALGYYLIISGIVFLILVLPLLYPMLHAIDASFMRSSPQPAYWVLAHSLQRNDLAAAQFLSFRPHTVFGMSSAFLYCPEILLAPLMMLGFFLAEDRIRRRLFPLLLLFLLALIFSSRWYIFLTHLPLFGKFRWPFKVFLFSEFFLVAALVWSVSSWGKQSASSLARSSMWSLALMGVVLLSGLFVSLTHHERNFFSNITLPSSKYSLPPTVDLHLGRIITIADFPRAASAHRLLTHCYGTFFAAPSLGGYNPLVGSEQLRFSEGLDFPNVYAKPITPAVRQSFDAHAARYWIIDPDSNAGRQAETQGGLQLLSSEKDRLVFENTRALPIAYASTIPVTPCAVTYSGNSMLIPLSHAAAPLEISVGPTDGWWCRIDHGSWFKPAYQNDRLKIDVQGPDRLLEISYFDPRFRAGLRQSLFLLILLGLLMTLGHVSRQGKSGSR